LTPEERANYSYYQKKLYSDRDELQAAVNRGREEGREEGIQIGEARGEAKGKAEGKAEGERNKAFEIAKNLLSQGVDVKTISLATGLSPEEIAELSLASS